MTVEAVTTTGAVMRAALLDGFGDASTLRLGSAPRPEPVLDEVLVRVLAAGVTTTDVRMRAGFCAATGVGSWPAVLGHDISGVVVRSPSDSFRLRPGDEVFGVSAAPRAPGGFAEFVAVPASRLARKPRILSHPEAAAVPSAALTAWAAVVDAAQVHEGQRLLIHAGDSCAAPFAVGLAVCFGARVTATGPADRLHALREWGAEAAVDERGPAGVSLIDAVIDLRSGETDPRAVGALRRGGLLVAPADGLGTAARAAAGRARVRATGFTVVPDSATLAVVDRLITAGDLVAPVPAVLPFERIADAHRLVESGRGGCGVVLRIADA